MKERKEFNIESLELSTPDFEGSNKVVVRLTRQ